MTGNKIRYAYYTSGKRERKRDPLCENCVTSRFCECDKKPKKKKKNRWVISLDMVCCSHSHHLCWHSTGESPIRRWMIHSPVHNNVRVLLLCAGLWRQQRNDNNRTCWGSLSLFFSVCVFSGDTALRCQSKWELSYSLSLSFGSYGLFSLLAPGNWERFFGAIQSEWSQLVLSVSWVSIRGRFPLKRTKITRTQLAKNLKKKNKQTKKTGETTVCT